MLQHWRAGPCRDGSFKILRVFWVPGILRFRLKQFLFKSVAMEKHQTTVTHSVQYTKVCAPWTWTCWTRKPARQLMLNEFQKPLVEAKFVPYNFSSFFTCPGPLGDCPPELSRRDGWPPGRDPIHEPADLRPQCPQRISEGRLDGAERHGSGAWDTYPAFPYCLI